MMYYVDAAIQEFRMNRILNCVSVLSVLKVIVFFVCIDDGLMKFYHLIGIHVNGWVYDTGISI